MSTAPRRIVIVAWHFPPSDEIAGRITWRLARQLALSGCDVLVLAPPLTAILARDETYASSLPVGLRVLRTGMRRSLLSYLVTIKRGLRQLVGGRGALAESAPVDAASAPAPVVVPSAGMKQYVIEIVRSLPDSGRGWITTAAQELRRVLQEQPVDLVLSVSPALSAHLAVARADPAAFGVPWFAWSHDPEALNPFMARLPKWRNRLTARWEEAALRKADQVLVTSAQIAQAYGTLFPGVRAPLVMSCGFDRDEILAAPSPTPRSYLLIAHVGTLYGHRTARPVVEAIARLLASGKLQEGELKLKIVGKLENSDSTELPALISRLGVASSVELLPPVSHARAQQIAADADVGLILAEQQPLQVPAKLFECIGLARPMLALAEGATADLIRDAGIGLVCDRAQLEDSLLQLLQQWRLDRLQSYQVPLQQAAHHFNMQSIAATLLDRADQARAHPLREAAG